MSKDICWWVAWSCQTLPPNSHWLLMACRIQYSLLWPDPYLFFPASSSVFTFLYHVFQPDWITCWFPNIRFASFGGILPLLVLGLVYEHPVILPDLQGRDQRTSCTWGFPLVLWLLNISVSQNHLEGLPEGRWPGLVSSQSFRFNRSGDGVVRPPTIPLSSQVTWMLQVWRLHFENRCCLNLFAYIDILKTILPPPQT